ncbi:MAG: YckD family protein [Desulfitobacterium sp.]
MKKKIITIFASVSILALAAVPTYAAMTDQQKTEIDALNQQMLEVQKQIVDKYAEAGEITQDQAEATKDNIDVYEKNRQQYSGQYGSNAPAQGYGWGYGPGYCCGGGAYGGGYYGGRW